MRSVTVETYRFEERACAGDGRFTSETTVTSASSLLESVCFYGYASHVLMVQNSAIAKGMYVCVNPSEDNNCSILWPATGTSGLQGYREQVWPFTTPLYKPPTTEMPLGCALIKGVLEALKVNYFVCGLIIISK